MDYNQLKNKMKGEALGEQEAKFYEMTSKGQLAGMGKDAPGSPFGTVSSAPTQTVTGAAQGESFEGSGGYKYGMLPNGDFVILKSGRGAAAGTVVKPDMKGYNDIKKEFEAVKAGRPLTTKPRSAAPKAESRAPARSVAAAAEAPRGRGMPNARSKQSMQEPGDPRMGESTRDEPRGGESKTRTPAELKSSQVYNAAALATRAMNALVREGTEPMAASKIVQGLKQSGNTASLEGLARLRK